MRRYRKANSVISLVLAAVLAVGCLPVGASAASSKEIQKQLDGLKSKKAELQKEIDAIQRDYDANFGEMEALVAEKNTIDQEMTLINSKIETTNQEIIAYSRLIADTQEELEDAQESLRELSEAHRTRVRVMEEEGDLTYWEVLFAANSFTDLLDRLNMIEEINAADRRRIEQMRIAADIVTATQMNLETEKSALEEVRIQLSEDEKILAEKSLQYYDLLYELEQKAEAFEVLIAESEVLQEELMLEFMLIIKKPILT